MFFLSCFLVIFGFPGQSVGISAVTDAILQSTGISRSLFSVIYTSATVTGCCLVLISGSLVDRFGIRRVTLASLTIWTAVFFILSEDEFLYKTVFARILSRSAYFAAFLYLCLSTLRFFGQNMLPMLGRMRIVKKFNERQSVAIALNGVFVTISSGVCPRIMRFLSRGGDWQNAYKVLSVVSLAVLFVFFFLFHDGETKIRKQMDGVPKLPSLGVRRKLVKMPVFWCIMGTLCINAFIGSGSMVHVVDIFRENGIGAGLAINSGLYLSCVSIPVGFVFGKKLDKNRIKSCILLLLSVQFFGLVGLETSGNSLGFWMYVVCIGASWGGYGILKTVSWAKMFGEKNLGAILGVVYFSSAIVGAMSVSLMSFSREYLGSYFHMVHLVECAILITAVFVVRKFPKCP